MHEALHANQLALHYQPIVNLHTFAITGVEALLRWGHPSGGTLLPDDFLPAVAPTPVMREVTRYVLRLACRDAARWPSWNIAVNVAASDLGHQYFVDDVTAALQGAGLDPSRLTLELTEQSVVQDIGRATTYLQRLRDLGVAIALDDFGIGYSSLLYLRELPITHVKIDRVFVSALEHSEEDAAIVESIVKLARSIKIEVIAEGVENATQARFLQSIGCHAAQGYLFARPKPPEDLDPGLQPEWVGGRPARGRRRRAKATADARTIDIVRHLLADGASLHTIAAALNRTGSVTVHDTRWTAGSVASLVTALPDA
jgi:EAL domain-containing protein (putative c-di-GMP-specific phosphodiesterase class I)